MNDEPQIPQSPDPPDTGKTARSPARRLLRSPDDRVIAGVCGGLGRYFNVDPILFRIAFAASLLLGGLGGLLYLGAWVFVPAEDGVAQTSTPVADPACGRARGGSTAGACEREVLQLGGAAEAGRFLISLLSPR